tara:strand:+ start:901 stop:1116 length:216 start_codon:yes stop_codon:yes gene_type:complete
MYVNCGYSHMQSIIDANRGNHAGNGPSRNKGNYTPLPARYNVAALPTFHDHCKAAISAPAPRKTWRELLNA